MSFAGQQGIEEHFDPPSDEARESPRHGFQGDRAPPPPASGLPASLTVAVSREAGSRGNTIAARAAAKLGWPAYNQELLEYIAQEGAAGQREADSLPPDATGWVEGRLQILQARGLSQHPSLVRLARTVLTLGAQGEVVLIGRAAGHMLPPESTLHVRIIAPLPDRIAYVSQWLRLSAEDAAHQVRARDQRRAEFLATHFQRRSDDIYQYDLLLNSSLLGEEACAELIVHAVRAKLASRERRGSSLPAWTAESVH
jgi:cytidylate kinase